MPPFKYRAPTFAEGREILANPLVAKALHKEAQRRLIQARQIARREKLDDFADALEVRDGVRPKGRSYSYVIADIESGEATEWGDNNTVRRRVLGQVQSGQPGTEE